MQHHHLVIPRVWTDYRLEEPLRHPLAEQT